jgi:hypothetical protein
MRVTGSTARAALGLLLSACASVVAAQQPDPFRIVRHDVVVDVPREEIVFNLWFSEPPDFATFDQFGRQATAFLFSLEFPDYRNFGRRGSGEPELVWPYIRVISGEEATGARVVARVITPGRDDWGPIVATAEIQQLGERVSFRLPLSIIDSGDMKFDNDVWLALHYFLEAYRYGYTTYSLARGVATVGTVKARLEVERRDLKNGNGAKRRFVIARVMAVRPTAEDPFPFESISPEFVDVGSVRFGPKRALAVGNELKDVNGDGLDDLVLMFNAADVGLTCIDKDVRLTGEIPSPGNFVPEGTVFIGRAALSPPPCSP